MFFKNPGRTVDIHVDQLCIGIYVFLPSGWSNHPFLFNQFRLSSQEQIDILRESGFTTVRYFPEKSTVEPLPLPQPGEAEIQAAPPTPEPHEALDARLEQNNAMVLRRARIVQVERDYSRMAENVRGVMLNVHSSSPQAYRQANDMITDVVDRFLKDQDVILHMITEGGVGENNYFHALNVMVLSLLLGKNDGTLPEQLHVLGTAALFHDIGKIKVPAAVLRKTAPLNKYEEETFRLHTIFGEHMALEGKLVPAAALEAIRHHHERLDGSGYPDRLAGDAISPFARIVAIANRYDNLCNSLQVDKSMTPSEALSHMFRRESALYDPVLLQRFVKLLGIYPPGSLVQLSDGTLGLVVAVNKEHSLRPDVLIYDQTVTKKNAPVVSLAENADLKIEKILRRANLPAAVLEYLSPRQRTSYFYGTQPRE